MERFIKNKRESYYKHLGKAVTEVQVQFNSEPPAWIPYETLLAMPCKEDV